MREVTLHTTHCPKCEILKEKLDEAKIEYTINEDVSKMVALGMRTAPFLEIRDDSDDSSSTLIDFMAAYNWIKKGDVT